MVLGHRWNLFCQTIPKESRPSILRGILLMQKVAQRSGLRLSLESFLATKAVLVKKKGHESDANVKRDPTGANGNFNCLGNDVQF